jgi:uncharacterized protein (DUF2235 family)
VKKIILCSDGTGNTGGKLNGTNVFRLFDAIERAPYRVAFPGGSCSVEQIPIYDDGVGTDGIKLLRLLGGAFGHGLTRNLEKLYAQLVLNFSEGDEIYLFGFSRGAFTVRAVANLLFYCGIADVEGKDRHYVLDIAKKAVKAYKKRDPDNPDAGAPALFRDAYGLLHRARKDGHDKGGPAAGKLKQDLDVGRFPIKFIGVWDTVEAIGLPFNELTDAYYKLFPLRFREKKGTVRENDLHPLIENAYHALSVDDERHTFHPILWIEDAPRDPVTEKKLDETDFRKFGAVPYKKPVVEQVWFAGVHANVGGGYPVDQMACVSLDWMMEKAAHCGLRFNNLASDYKRDADVQGRMYDSRAGMGIFYRYRPRDLKPICLGAGITTPKIHASVLQRILARTAGYAPTGIPADFDVIDGAAPAPADHDGRKKYQNFVDDFIWLGRASYALFVGWGIVVVAAALALRGGTAPDIAGWDPFWQFLYGVLSPILRLAAWVTPSYFSPGIVALKNHPGVMLSLLAILGGILWLLHWLRAKSLQHCDVAWLIAYSHHHPSNAEPRIPLVRSLRDSGAIKEFANKFYWWFVPKATLIMTFPAVLLLLFWWGYPAFILAKNTSVTDRALATENKAVNSARFEFDTRNPMQATPVWIEAGQYYVVHVETTEEWKDNDLPAGPGGLTQTPAWMEKNRTARRIKDQPWYALMASIGPDEEEVIAIGSGRSIRPRTTGRLYLFVNDAYGFYGNNHGKATIAVERKE